MEKNSSRPVAIWLMTGVVMIIIQIILGGITRLTGSGLSITEWDVITGSLPPLSEQQWVLEFNKYKQTPQYRLLNADFTISNFKFIFFWEWLHRLWGRLIGVVFFIPFLVFLVQKRFRSDMVAPLAILFLLGALQGAVGWIMVASGLTGDAIYVRPTRLAMHFIFAIVLLVYTFWFSLKLLVKEESRTNQPALKKLLVLIIAVLFIQLIYGALMAGHKAASAAPTWPDINGSIFPDYVFNRPEGWISAIDNPIVIHFIHRTLAYLLLLMVIAWTLLAVRVKGYTLFSGARWLPIVFILLQLILGILTVISSLKIAPAQWGPFEWMAQLHQVVAFLLLLALTLNLYLLTGKKRSNYTTAID